MPPQFAVDIRPCGNAHMGRGIGRYVRNLVAPLTPELTDAVVLADERRTTVPRLHQTPSSISTAMPRRPHLRFDPLMGYVTRHAMEQRGLAFAHITDPYLVHLAPRNARLIATVYDLIQLESPGYIADRFRAGLAFAARQEDTLYLTISEVVAGDLLGLGIGRDQIVVIPPGPTAWPAPIASIDFQGALVVGAIDAHKRPEHALEASRLAGVPVMFAGRHDPRRLAEVGIGHDQRRSDISDAELAQLIRQATAVIHASASEGFGLPVLEAISLGTPVVAYDLPVTREIVGPGYPLVPESAGPAGLAELLRAFTDPDERAHAVHAAASFSSRFSWESARQSLRELYAHLQQRGG